MPGKMEAAPGFKLQDQDGNLHELAEYKGKWVVLFFYPRANTPGCTRESVAFSALAAKFKQAGAAVLGVSPDNCAAQKKFEANHGLAVRLLSDPDKAIAAAYGAFGEKVMYGKKVKGIIRSTFLIDPRGRIARSWFKVKVDGHADEVLAALKELKSQAK